MIRTWGGPDVVAPDGSTRGPSQPSLPGFDGFMMERFSPLVWVLPSNTDFNPKDAQAKQALGEAAAMHKAIYAKTGQQYLNHLQETEFKNMGWDQETATGYLQALSASDTKKFRQYFQVSEVFNHLLKIEMLINIGTDTAVEAMMTRMMIGIMYWPKAMMKALQGVEKTLDGPGWHLLEKIWR